MQRLSYLEVRSYWILNTIEGCKVHKSWYINTWEEEGKRWGRKTGEKGGNGIHSDLVHHESLLSKQINSVLCTEYNNFQQLITLGQVLTPLITCDTLMSSNGWHWSME